MDANKPLEDDDMDGESEQFLADLPSASRSAPSSTAPAQPTPSAAPSGGQEQERRAQVSASPYLAPFTPSGSPPRPKTPSTAVKQRNAKPQLVPVRSGAFQATPTLPRDDVVAHLPPKLLETLVDVVRTLDQLADGVADVRPDQLGFLAEKTAKYVDLLQQTDKAAKDYHADIPLEVLKMLDEQDASNPELFTRQQLEKCQEESEHAAGKADALEMLKSTLQVGLDEMK